MKTMKKIVKLERFIRDFLDEQNEDVDEIEDIDKFGDEDDRPTRYPVIDDQYRVRRSWPIARTVAMVVMAGALTAMVPWYVQHHTTTTTSLNPPRPVSVPVTRSTVIPTPPTVITDRPAEPSIRIEWEAGSTAQCRDGWFSHSHHRSGTCSGHHGVAVWRYPATDPIWK